MSKEVTPEELVRALAKIGYFQDKSFIPDNFCTFVENTLNVGRERAINILTNSKLAVFEYDPNPSIHPREKIDYWRLVLTNEGVNIVNNL